MYLETGLIRRQYMKVSTGSIAAPTIGWRVFCLALLCFTRKEDQMSDAPNVKWSKEDDLLSGDPEAMPKLIAAQRLTIARQAQEIEQIRELLGCHRAYITATIQDMLIKAEQQAQEIKRLKQEKNAVVIELYRKLDAKDEHLAAMTAERDAAEQQVAQLDHKNCDLMRRNRILRTRPDLPMTHEEKARYKQLENQVARLREMAEHAVNEEPEMPGEMPLALYEQIKQLDRAGMAEWARIIAWQTKAGVLGRLHALLETEGE